MPYLKLCTPHVVYNNFPHADYHLPISILNCETFFHTCTVFIFRVYTYIRSVALGALRSGRERREREIQEEIFLESNSLEAQGVLCVFRHGSSYSRKMKMQNNEDVTFTRRWLDQHGAAAKRLVNQAVSKGVNLLLMPPGKLAAYNLK